MGNLLQKLHVEKCFHVLWEKWEQSISSVRTDRSIHCHVNGPTAANSTKVSFITFIESWLHWVRRIWLGLTTVTFYWTSLHYMLQKVHGAGLVTSKDVHMSLFKQWMERNMFPIREFTLILTTMVGFCYHVLWLFRIVDCFWNKKGYMYTVLKTGMWIQN